VTPVHRHLAVAAAMACTFCSSGCLVSTRRDLPPDWPQRLERGRDECPDLAGRWEARAMEDAFTWERRELALLLHPMTAPSREEPKPAAWVELARPDAETLVVRRGLGEDQVGEVATLRRVEDFVCVDGALRTVGRGRWDNANICGAYTSGSFTLWRDARGGLILRQAATDACIGLANAVGWSVGWERFLPWLPP